VNYDYVKFAKKYNLRIVIKNSKSPSAPLPWLWASIFMGLTFWWLVTIMQGARPVRAVSGCGPTECRGSRGTRILFLLAATPPHMTQLLSQPEWNPHNAAASRNKILVPCTSMRTIMTSSSLAQILQMSARPAGGPKAVGTPYSRRLTAWASTMFSKQRSSLLMVSSTRLTSANTLTSFGKFTLWGVYAQAVYDEVSSLLFSQGDPRWWAWHMGCSHEHHLQGTPFRHIRLGFHCEQCHKHR
jgi:hypothetical protein